MAKSKALVFGATGGIGREIVLKLSQDRSIDIYATSRNEISTFPQGIKKVKIPDLSDSKSFEEWLSTLGEFEYVINCSGVARDNLLGRIKLDDIHESINVNLVSNILIANKFLPSMLVGGFGRIVFLGSIVGASGNAGQCVYSSSKAALRGLVRSSAKEITLFSQKNNREIDVTINLIEPGFTDTEMVRKVPREIIDKILRRKPNQDLLMPSQIANFTIDLLKTKSPFNGSVIELNGGLIL